jgi:hypothetical protein
LVGAQFIALNSGFRRNGGRNELRPYIGKHVGDILYSRKHQTKKIPANTFYYFFGSSTAALETLIKACALQVLWTQAVSFMGIGPGKGHPLPG